MKHRGFGLGMGLGLLVITALLLPLPLYILALALFGLPHVLWELAWLRQRYAGHQPRSWWWAVGGVLLWQAGTRLAIWLDVLDPRAGPVIDLASLGLLGAAVLLGPRSSRPTRLAGMLLAIAMGWALASDHLLIVLLSLAMLHNFSPLALAWDLARDQPDQRPTAWLISILFALPLLIAALPLPFELFDLQATLGDALNQGLHGLALPLPNPGLLDGQLTPGWGDDSGRRHTLLSALVLAQCLHYLSVIHLLPATGRLRRDAPLLNPRLRQLALLLSAALVIGFMIDYRSTRGLYAVASGLHAWLEWPILLLAITARPMRACQPQN
jgi:hypothetical protein